MPLVAVADLPSVLPGSFSDEIFQSPGGRDGCVATSSDAERVEAAARNAEFEEALANVRRATVICVEQTFHGNWPVDGRRAVLYYWYNDERWFSKAWSGIECSCRGAHGMDVLGLSLSENERVWQRTLVLAMYTRLGNVHLSWQCTLVLAGLSLGDH